MDQVNVFPTMNLNEDEEMEEINKPNTEVQNLILINTKLFLASSAKEGS